MTELQSALDKVLKAIEQGQAKMRPRWQFVVRGIAVALLGIFLALVVVFFVSLAFFTWRSSSTGILPQFGARGWFLTFSEIPWWFVLLSLIGSIGLIFVLERTTPWYRKPVGIVFGAVTVMLLVAGGVVAETGFHDRFGPYAEEHHVLFFGPTYQQLHQRGSDILTIGVITAVHGKKLTVVTPGNEKLTVVLNDDTRLSMDWTPMLGDHIAVIGHRRGNTVTADACRPLGQFQPGQWFPPGQEPSPEGFLPVPLGPFWST